MNIREFKVGDIITRNEGCAYPSGDKDGSYCGDRIELLGLDETSKIIFLKNLDGVFKEEPSSLSFGRDKWDEGWSLYPESLWQKIKNIAK